MNTSFAEQLLIERKRFAIRANGVICAPLAGAIYWIVLAILAHYLSIQLWCFFAFIGSGTIFPLALGLQKLTKSNMMIKDTPLSGPGSYAFANMALCWALTIPAFHTDPKLVPLVLGIGMSLHLVATAWAMNLKSYLFHPLIRAAIVVTLWYAFPNQVFTIIPIIIGAIYLLTIPAVLKEIANHKASLKEQEL